MNTLFKNTDRKLAMLIDPDGHNQGSFAHFAKKVVSANPDFIFLGGSFVEDSNIDQFVLSLKAITSIPVVLFPGSVMQVSKEADMLLLLSLISGRNPELLIGQHVLAAPKLATMKDKVLSTGYILIDGGNPTSVSYISNTQPIPASKSGIAACTALAGSLLGMKCIYLDAGSGALNAVSSDTIKAVKERIDVPLIVGGGIKSRSMAEAAWDAGANVVVVGNILESQRIDFKSFTDRR